jgi:alpha-D-ribose 1-methylphosphonate 5-triphosphate diphosphatase PhnM
LPAFEVLRRGDPGVVRLRGVTPIDLPTPCVQVPVNVCAAVVQATVYAVSAGIQTTIDAITFAVQTFFDVCRRGAVFRQTRYC